MTAQESLEVITSMINRTKERYFGNGNILDMVEKYGYYDQAHLLNDFKKRHSLFPEQAVRLARY